VVVEAPGVGWPLREPELTANQTLANLGDGIPSPLGFDDPHL
jgi:hypothetical protein